MSDPVPIRKRARPRRAKPLQPDAPWRGAEAEPVGGSATDANDADSKASGKTGLSRAGRRQKSQSESALQNVREFD
jgi:hypothetical protein